MSRQARKDAKAERKRAKKEEEERAEGSALPDTPEPDASSPEEGSEA